MYWFRGGGGGEGEAPISAPVYVCGGGGQLTIITGASFEADEQLGEQITPMFHPGTATGNEEVW